jgi:hypothetical protein
VGERGRQPRDDGDRLLGELRGVMRIVVNPVALPPVVADVDLGAGSSARLISPRNSSSAFERGSPGTDCERRALTAN